MGLKHILLSARNILPGLYLGDDQVPVNRDTFGHAADWLARSASDRIQHLRKHMPKPEPVGRSPLLNHPPLFASDGTLNRVDYRKDISLGGYSVSILLKWHHDGAVRASKKFGFTDLYQLGLLYKGVNMPGVDRERGLLEVFGIIPGAELPDD